MRVHAAQQREVREVPYMRAARARAFFTRDARTARARVSGAGSAAYARARHAGAACAQHARQARQRHVRPRCAPARCASRLRGAER